MTDPSAKVVVITHSEDGETCFKIMDHAEFQRQLDDAWWGDDPEIESPASFLRFEGRSCSTEFCESGGVRMLVFPLDSLIGGTKEAPEAPASDREWTEEEKQKLAGIFAEWRAEASLEEKIAMAVIHLERRGG